MNANLTLDTKKLVMIRYKMGLSLREVEEGSGITSKTICDMENQKRSPSPKTLMKLCQFYMIDLSEVAK